MFDFCVYGVCDCDGVGFWMLLDVEWYVVFVVVVGDVVFFGEVVFDDGDVV